MRFVSTNALGIAYAQSAHTHYLGHSSDDALQGPWHTRNKLKYGVHCNLDFFKHIRSIPLFPTCDRAHVLQAGPVSNGGVGYGSSS